MNCEMQYREIASPFLSHFRSSLSERRSRRPTTLDFVERIIAVAVAAQQMAADALATYAAAARQISQFVAAVLFFHVSEYLLAILFHGRSNVSWSSLLISKHYVIAMGFALVEYTVEVTLFPQLKEFWFVSNCGLVMILIGEVIRKAAIITAGRAFTHLIRIYYEEQHVLVTHGVYSIMRHPSYCGFFIWAVGTQVMLCNPVSVVAFVLVIWRFFSRRIPYEEFFLRQFFGREYIEYAQKVPSGLPFIK